MNYLKKFEELVIKQDNTERGQTIKDICLELEDKGLYVYTFDRYPHAPSSNYLQINIKKLPATNCLFTWDDIKDCILRLKDYLGDDFITFDYMNSTEQKIYKVNNVSEDTIINDKLFRAYIKYKIN